MAKIGLHFPLFFLMLAFIFLNVSAQPYKTLVAPIIKDTNTSLYSITLNFHEHYVIDIHAPLLWYICQRPHPPVGCQSPECIQARTYLSALCPPTNNTYKNGQCTCNVTPVNPVTKSCASSQLTYNNLIISWTDGKNPTVGINFNHLYVSCAPTALLQSLPGNVIGVAGLSWAPLALSSQFTPPYLGLTKKFALCLPSTSRSRGVIFFGDGPYYLMPPTQFDAGSILSYTPLVKKSNSPEYYVSLKAISINGKESKLKSNVFEFDSLGYGGVMLSTVVPYTTLRSDIYKVFLKDFAKATGSIPRVKKVKPFGLCLNSSTIGFSRVGLHVPQIDLLLENGKNWTIIGANSMKRVGNDVACLAFVDGGKTAQQAVVIGSLQMENNFLQFDLDQSRLGFSSSLLFFRTTCANFNFTSGV